MSAIQSTDSMYVFAAVLSCAALDDSRDERDTEGFDDSAAAGRWAENQLREHVAHDGSAWEWRVDVARIDRADWDADSWHMGAETIMARAEWDTATGAVVWQSGGPFSFAEYV